MPDRNSDHENDPISLPGDFEEMLAALLAVRPEGSDEPPSAVDVAAAIIRARPELDQMQLHKLLYLTQAAQLAWYGTSAFKERIEAWRWGPMVRRVAGHYKNFGRNPIKKPASGNPDNVPRRTLLVMERVLGEYGSLDGPTLADMTKVVGGPWHQVWGDRPPEATGQDEIPVVVIANYHRRHGMGGEIARRHGLRGEVATPTEAALIKRYLEGDKDAFPELLALSIANR